MAEHNEHIVEVLCAMWFEPEMNDWDSTYFGKYHERILSMGFTEKQEQKGFEVKFEIHPVPSQEVTDSKIRMIFRNPKQKTAIILAEHYISFHKLAPYSSWENLMTDIVEPGLRAYREIGLGNGLKEVQCLYLNKHVLAKDESISSVFGFWPSIEEGFETNILFQTKYDMSAGVTVQLKLNGGANDIGVRELFFECTTFVKATPDDDYRVLAGKAHDYANMVYEKLMRN